MSLNVPTKRLLQSAAAASSPSTSTRAILSLQSLSISSPSPSHLPITQRRSAWFGWGRKSKSDIDVAAQVHEELNPNKKKSQLDLVRKMTAGGNVESDSIFSDELAGTEKKTGPVPGGGGEGLSRDKDVLARAVDPDPRSRVRWERKMVIRHVAKATDPFSKESRAARIKRTEKELHEKSPWMATSTKKLVHLSRQIAGKSVEEALVQMRYSKKKMAKEIAYQIELARDRAVVERGMGLGKEEAKTEKIVTKDGKHMEVGDPTKLYIAQSWVERGPWRGYRKSPRARGRMDLIKRPSASVSVLLKEQKTLVREHKEREEKKYRQGPWVHLPDRPITAQRQHYSW